MLEGILYLSDWWWEWIISCLAGMILLYLVGECVIRFGKYISAEIRYWILILILVKCCVPTIFTIGVPFVSWPVQEYVNIQSVNQTNPGTIDIHPQRSTNTILPKMANHPSGVQQNNIVRFNLLDYLFVFNILGSFIILVLIVKKVIGHKKLCKRLYDQNVIEICNRLSKRLNIRMPDIYVSEQIEEATYTGGFIHSYIVIEKRWLNVSDEQKELLLAHELLHIKRWDPIINWFQIVMTVLFWWNPIVARLNYLIRCEREHCVDDMVLQKLTVAPLNYSKMLLHAAENQVFSQSLHWQITFADPVHSLKNRIRRIMMKKTNHYKLKFAGIAILIFFVTTSFLGFQLQQANGKTSLAQQATKAYKEQWKSITSTNLTYDEENAIPPLALQGMDRVEKRRELIKQQENMLELARQSENYDPEGQERVKKSLDKLKAGINNPRYFHEEITYITKGNYRCKERNRFGPELYISKAVCNRLNAFSVLYHPEKQVLQSKDKHAWFIPTNGMCRFGADMGWWLENGFRLQDMEDRKLALLDPDGKLMAVITVDPSLNYAWTHLSILNDHKIIICEDFEMMDGLPVPNTVIVKEKVADGSYFQISKKTLQEAKVNIDIDNSIFEKPEDFETNMLNR